ncbi:MAG: hypothetical protein SFW65_01260 [Alphaproteobacteria bacterium]|nr:hypothetical protein [Alphaproteobacteria bacterium]
MTYWNNPDYSASGAPQTPFTRPLEYCRELFIENETRFIRLYDKYYFQKEGIWLFGTAQFKEETPEQLRDLLGLPFVPIYICDVFVKPSRILIYFISDANNPSKKGQLVSQAEQGLRFENERLLKPNTPIQQQLGNQPE